MRFPRASGILLHPTSLPGRFGIGDFGAEAREFVDFLEDAGQKYWQILPLGPTGYGDSPYSSFSAFAGNTKLISPDEIVRDELITETKLADAPRFEAGRADYGGVYGWKRSLLTEAFDTFRTRSDWPFSEEYEFFCRENAWWLDDYALFRALIESHDHKPWFEWPEPLRRRDKDALEQAGVDLKDQIEAERFFQYLFFRQWLALKSYANERSVKIIGDIPIFVAIDACDVWCNQNEFKLSDDGSPVVVAGVPPDYFSKTGQRWGNPIYDWHAMMANHFNWWTARLSFALQIADIVRLDHFIGFVRNWEVPADEKTAKNGVWADVPGTEFFSIIKRRLGDLPLIAEDLGSLTPEVEQLRDSLRLPGMKILQYAFGGDAANDYLPHNYAQNSVVYTGTHDNDTTAGWYRSAPKRVKKHAREYLNFSGRSAHWEMIRAALVSVSDTAIIPAQDLLGLGNESRMNKPATSDGNWSWRLRGGELNDKLAAKLRELTERYGR